MLNTWSRVFLVRLLDKSTQWPTVLSQWFSRRQLGRMRKHLSDFQYYYFSFNYYHFLQFLFNGSCKVYNFVSFKKHNCLTLYNKVNNTVRTLFRLIVDCRKVRMYANSDEK